MDKQINVNQVLQTIDTTIEELKNELNPNLLTEEDKVELNDDIDEVIKLALKAKLIYQQRQLANLIKSLDDDNVDIKNVKATSMEIGKAFRLTNKVA